MTKMNDKNGNELKVGDRVMRIGAVFGFDGADAVVRADGIDYYMPPGKLEKLPASEPPDGPDAQQLLAEIAALKAERDELLATLTECRNQLSEGIERDKLHAEWGATIRGIEGQAEQDRQTIRQLVEMLHRR